MNVGAIARLGNAARSRHDFAASGGGLCERNHQHQRGGHRTCRAATAPPVRSDLRDWNPRTESTIPHEAVVTIDRSVTIHGVSRYGLWRADADALVPSAVGGASRD